MRRSAFIIMERLIDGYDYRELPVFVSLDRSLVDFTIETLATVSPIRDLKGTPYVDRRWVEEAPLLEHSLPGTKE